MSIDDVGTPRTVPAVASQQGRWALRRWIAFQFVGVPGRGVTNPAFFRCVLAPQKSDPTLRLATFLVKQPGVDPLAREIVGANLARVAGLRVPEPGLIHLPAELAASTSRTLQAGGRFYKFSEGYSAGSWQIQLSPVARITALPARRRDDALRLYIFDMLAGNADRVESNPNCAYTKTGLTVYDFEQCFPSERRFGEESVEPWCMAEEGGLGRLHMFHPALQGADVRLMAGDILTRLAKQDLTSWPRRLPAPWRLEASRIVQHIRSVLDNDELFLNDLQRSLA